MFRDGSNLYNKKNFSHFFKHISTIIIITAEHNLYRLENRLRGQFNNEYNFMLILIIYFLTNTIIVCWVL